MHVFSTTFVWSPILQPFSHEYTTGEIFQKKSRISICCKSSSLPGRGGAGTDRTVRGGVKPTEIMEYMLQQLWLCAGFFSWVLGWLWKRYITGCVCVRGCCLILLSDLSVSQKSLFVGQFHDSERSERRIKRQKSVLLWMLKTLLALFAFHFRLTGCQMTDTSGPCCSLS